MAERSACTPAYALIVHLSSTSYTGKTVKLVTGSNPCSCFCFPVSMGKLKECSISHLREMLLYMYHIVHMTYVTSTVDVSS